LWKKKKRCLGEEGKTEGLERVGEGRHGGQIERGDGGPQRRGQTVLNGAREDKGINFIEKQERGLRKGETGGERGKRVHREVQGGGEAETEG
jgi:hypothetical protein